LIQRYAQERSRIARTDAEQQARRQPRQNERSECADVDSARRNRHSLPRPSAPAPAAAERQTNEKVPCVWACANVRRRRTPATRGRYSNRQTWTFHHL